MQYNKKTYFKTLKKFFLIFFTWNFEKNQIKEFFL